MQAKILKKLGGIDGLCLIEPNVHEDERGYFMETYNQNEMSAQGLKMKFVQDNQSCSAKGVLRGLHYQIRFPQCKLVRVFFGEIFDVAVDLRPGSVTFGKWHGEYLSAANKKQLLIPEGFAHGFLTLSPKAELFYKVTDFYHPDDEGGIAWNDPGIGIDWGVTGIYDGTASGDGYTLKDGTPVILSKKDKDLRNLRK